MEKRPGSALTKKNQKADLHGKLTPNMSLWSGEGGSGASCHCSECVGMSHWGEDSTEEIWDEMCTLRH